MTNTNKSLHKFETVINYLTAGVFFVSTCLIFAPGLKAQPTPCIDPSCSVLEDFSELDKSIERQMTEYLSCPNDNVYYENESSIPMCRACPAGYRVNWDMYGQTYNCKRE